MTKSLKASLFDTHTILQGDCVSLSSRLAKNSVDMIFADPPYNLQLQGDLNRPDGSHVDAVTDAWDQFESLKAYDKFCHRWLRQARRVLKDSGSLWVIGSYHNIFRLGSIIQDLGFWILNDIIWVKNNPMPNFRGCRFTNAHETLLWCAKDRNAKPTFNYQVMKALNEGKQMRSDWYLPLCTGSERLKREDGQKLHSTQKPENLLKRVILASTKQGDRVLDLFAGTGTTLAAAKSLHRRSLGFEQNEDYVQGAKKRITAVQPYDKEAIDTIKQPQQLSRIPFGKLVESGMLIPGTRLESPDQRFVAEVTSEGLLKSGTHHGSIHAVGASLSEAQSCNGWTYWHVKDHKKRVPIDALRQYLRKLQEAPPVFSDSAKSASLSL